MKNLIERLARIEEETCENCKLESSELRAHVGLCPEVRQAIAKAFPDLVKEFFEIDQKVLDEAIDSLFGYTSDKRLLQHLKRLKESLPEANGIIKLKEERR